MIFMVLVGGLGTLEGPILGAVIFFSIEYLFGETGVWYLIGLGAAAVVFALFMPRGLWGTLEDKLGIRLMPVGYHLRLLRPNLADGAALYEGSDVTGSPEHSVDETPLPD